MKGINEVIKSKICDYINKVISLLWGIRNRINKVNAEIIALSPNDRLFDEKSEYISDFAVYEHILHSAFANRRVRNVAITGNHGVGKSSIIRSYEARKTRRSKGYLYVSLMDFKDGAGFGNKQIENTDLLKSVGQKQLQQEFERYLLSQILSKVDAQSLPHSTFRLIPSRINKLNILFSGLLTLLGLCVFGIAYKSTLGISENWVKYLYLICGLFGTVLVFWIILYLSNSLVATKLSATCGIVKLETEAKTNTNSYIDDHMFEIVYALEKMAHDISYTVVLEDIDRLGKDICVDIFSKLRRINFLVNDRNKLKGKYIRFVYAFDDSVFEQTKNTKFFDYVMSVTPRLNYSTGGDYFKKMMLESFSGENDSQKEILEIINKYEVEFWHRIGFVVHDYRMLNHIRNDFQLFVNVMLKRQLEPNKKWLPFVLYKNILANDYCHAFETKSVLELSKEDRDNKIERLCSIKGEHYSEFVKRLFDYIVETISLKVEDFHKFTGLPSEVVDIRTVNIIDVRINDILSKKLEPDNKIVGPLIEKNTVLVTGGSGAIGSELCRQIASYKVRKLIIVDINENNTYDIQMELKYFNSTLDLNVEIASVQDEDKINILFEKYKPDIVFHAAAHKHIPLMENDPQEAIKNNIFGTYNMICAAEKHGVKKFILVSTDKAENPTNVMGATKRFCEMIIQSYTESSTKFCAVRFGNVLGSNGSLIPLFKKQIEKGGPITITHKEITRFFMTTHEAVQRVLQAGGMTEQNQIYVLNMGEPIKIIDLAEAMIRLHGLKPYEDIDIVSTGLRPGEKLYEELLLSSDHLISTQNEKIFVVRQNAIRSETIINDLNRLKRAVQEHMNSDNLKALLAEIVPTYINQHKTND